ncbi:RagB/SusD family nutrient uptake outer membrane protein [Pedobacter sp. ASV12]|uniref:RagB/SusD family nutrient uptake outer membrane protein n=1 Tax=Pedobacter sp. ASV12 TaxID=2795120 RepID=UPI0018ED6456|nr:RagB/SusD family nutrient uptake outer membrane protein [Pedobacter sp. ASV12]
MKTLKIAAALLIGTALFAGCKDFLQDGSLAEGPITSQETWANDNYARGILNNAYFAVPDRFNLDGNGAMQASGSDEAVNSNLNSSINTFNNGTWSPVRTVDDMYGSLYEGLRIVNLFMANVQTSGITSQPSELTSPTAADQTLQAQINRLKGQAFFLRAYFHFELLARYGRIVLATKVFDRNENLNLPRNTFQECVDQIALDCDSAIARLPLWTQTWSSAQRGRATQTAAMALKARLFLYAASPQYNPTNDLTKWQKAADAAKALIDKNVHSLLSDYRNPFLFGANPYNNEVIFETQTPNRNDIEQNNAPISYDGALGRTNPTQELVDAFEMRTTGRPITDAASGYNANAPYTNRDNRLAFTIFCNGVVYKSPKTVDTYIGGKDGIGANVNATKTGYYMRKFFNDAVTWNQQSNTLSRRPWVIFRYAEVLLNYAEALNEAQGPVPAVYTYINMVRQRTGVALPALQSTNAAGNGYVPATKEAMRLRIQNERRVELCFEGHRFFDVRRWSKGEEFFNKPVTGMRITRNAANGTFSYERFTVENRVFSAKNYLYPISQSNLNRAPALGQNQGY